MSTLTRTAAVFTFLLPSAAWAGLGQPEASVASDHAALGGVHDQASGGAFVRHEIRLASGTTVREYAADGAVFAVAWDGPVRPDLRQLLGDYYDAAIAAARAAHRGHGPLVVRTPDLVVESGGHMRALTGRAYLPGRVPQDVALSVIR